MIIFLLLSLSGSYSHAEVTSLKSNNMVDQQTQKDNCIINITIYKFTDDVETLTYTHHSNNKKDCAKLANSHRVNFAPGAIRKKQVDYKWRK
ncbi:MAG: hypothetical protein KDD38_06830 [Bdellovibrionales bacterium]|nr:hypothetical protein [Bdellovibrionales bacterium]